MTVIINSVIRLYLTGWILNIYHPSYIIVHGLEYWLKEWVASFLSQWEDEQVRFYLSTTSAVAHCQFSGFSFTSYFMLFVYIIFNTAYLLPSFFMKSQYSLLKFFHFTISFFKFFFSTFFSKNLNCFLWRQSAWKCI